MVRVFEPSLYGSQLVKVRDFKCALWLELRAHRAREVRDRDMMVIFDTDSRHLRFHMTRIRAEEGSVPSSFSMLLRKHLRGLRIRGTELAESDRIVRIRFGDSEGDRYILAGYFHGGRSDIVLFDASGVWMGNFRSRIDGARALRISESGMLRSAGRDRFSDVPDFELVGYLDSYYGELLSTLHFTDMRGRLISEVCGALKRAERLGVRLSSEYERALDWERYKDRGDLLSAYYHQLVGSVRGRDRVSVLRFDGSGEEEIRLDVRKDLRGNIERYYKESKRKQRALSHLQSRISETESEAEQLRAKLSALESVESMEELETFGVEAGVGDNPEVSAKRARRGGSAGKLPERRSHRCFVSQSGIEIHVGRSAADNDVLTFREARGNELWLHAAGCSGSHVVIRSTDPDSETLMDACHLAHRYSNRGKMMSGEVYCTARKYVRRVKGGKAGQVQIGGDSRVLVVNVDVSRLDRLRGSRRY